MNQKKVYKKWKSWFRYKGRQIELFINNNWV
jgi:hypothetical protein